MEEIIHSSFLRLQTSSSWHHPVTKTKPALREDGAVANNTTTSSSTTTTAASIADHNYVADVWREALDVPNPPSEIQDLTRGAAGTGGGGDLFRMRSSAAPVARAPPRKIVR